jgi:hypothetical protein
LATPVFNIAALPATIRLHNLNHSGGKTLKMRGAGEPIPL